MKRWLRAVPQVDHGIEAQKAAEEHLAACQEYYWALESGEEPEGECPWSAPYDDCNTCVVREVLFAGWRYLEKIR